MKKVKNTVNYAFHLKRVAILLAVIELGTLSSGASAVSAECRVAATRCEVKDMINQAQFAPQPGEALPANVAVTLHIAATNNFQPAKSKGPSNYAGNGSLTLNVYNGTAAAVGVTCASATGSLNYYGYSGASITTATNVSLTPTPAGAATPPALSIATASAGATSTVSASTTAVTSFAPSNLWGVTMSGQYLCVITPTDTAYATATVLAPVNFSS